MTNSIPTRERLAILETSFKDFKKVVYHFIDNDFDHLRRKVNWIVGLLITTQASLILGLGYIILRGD